MSAPLTPRAAQIRAECALEAAAIEERRKLAVIQNNLAITRLGGLGRSHGSNREAQAERVSSKEAARIQALESAVNRDPCLHCGVRADLHDEQGCKRWRGR